MRSFGGDPRRTATRTVSELTPTLFPKFDLASRPNVVAAVSGGSDSVALLLLAKAHLDRTAPGTKLLAVTVDHGLRPESAAEASGVADLCAGEGIEHRTLVWSGPKPATGLPAAGREARYRLLAAAAQEAGTDIVLTGHTRDDQAETIAMRRRRGDGHGLAGMAPATLYGGKVWIVRPLLTATRAALRETLSARGLGWVEDPSNRDMAYERARTRAAGVDDFADEAARAARERMALCERVARLLEAHATQPSPGLIRLDPEFIAAERPVAVQALRILLAVMGGAEHLAEADRTAALYDRLAQGRLRATLSRCVVDARPAGIFLHREGRGLPAPTALRGGVVWDRRFIVDGDGGLLAPLGAEHARQMKIDVAGAPQSLARAAFAAWPASWDADGGAGPLRQVATTGGPSATPLVTPWARFLPCFDLAAARAVAALVGAREFPPPPFAGHIAREA